MLWLLRTRKLPSAVVCGLTLSAVAVACVSLLRPSKMKPGGNATSKVRRQSSPPMPLPSPSSELPERSSRPALAVKR